MFYSISQLFLASGVPEILYEDKYEETQVLKAGGTLILPVSVSGHPEPNISWYHGETELSSANGISIERKDKLSTLTVKGMNSKKAGTYRVTAENSVGSDEAEFTVKVRGRN